MPRLRKPADERARPCELFHRLQDRTRLGVLFALAGGGEWSHDQLAAVFHVTPQTISQHLHEVGRFGLIDKRGDGQFRWFRLRPSVLAADGMIDLGSGVRVGLRRRLPPGPEDLRRGAQGGADGNVPTGKCR
jgi:DNA-binding transcriptional ArsR family regulator